MLFCLLYPLLETVLRKQVLFLSAIYSLGDKFAVIYVFLSAINSVGGCFTDRVAFFVCYLFFWRHVCRDLRFFVCYKPCWRLFYGYRSFFCLLSILLETSLP